MDGVIAIIAVIVGYFLGRLGSFLDEKKAVKKEFFKIKNNIYAAIPHNDFFPEVPKAVPLEHFSQELSELRRFFIENDHLLKISENETFRKKWLRKWDVAEGEKPYGDWTDGEVSEMFGDLRNVRLSKWYFLI